jgi:hypothetical protein
VISGKNQILRCLPLGVKPLPEHAHNDFLVLYNGRLWAIWWNNLPFQSQEFYLWNGDDWMDKTEKGSPGPRVPYKSIERLIEGSK